LLNKKAAVNIKNNCGNDALAVAIATFNGNQDIINELYKANAKCKNPLITAVNFSNFQAVQLFSTKEKYLNLKNEQGDTPLTAAIKIGNLKIINKLIEKNVNIDLQDRITGD
jgi:ankyrin repeat protein